MIKSILLNLPLDIYNKVAALAKSERRSITAQIIYLLEVALKEVDKAKTL